LTSPFELAKHLIKPPGRKKECIWEPPYEGKGRGRQHVTQSLTKMNVGSVLVVKGTFLLLIAEVVVLAELPDLPLSPTDFKEPPGALIRFLEYHRITSLFPMPQPEQLSKLGLTDQVFEDYSGAAWVPNTSDPSLGNTDPLVVSNGLFRVVFERNYLKTKMPAFFIGETLEKKLSADEVFTIVESRFGGIKLSETENFYALGPLRIASPYPFKLDNRFYYFWCRPCGTIGGMDKRTAQFAKTVLIFEVHDETPLVEAESGAVVVTPNRLATPAPDHQSWKNSLGMKFVVVPGIRVLFSAWDTRVQDYAAFSDAANGVDSSWRQVEYKGGRVSDGLDHPVTMVSWNDAEAFCQWLTDKERRAGVISQEQSYRLPTDTEWSAAVGLDEERGDTPEDKDSKIKGVYPWGTAWPPPTGAGNYDPSLNVDTYKSTSPVGGFAANRYGLYDMGGDVWQWCEDWYNKEQKRRVLRGASWCNIGRDSLLSSSRFYRAPGERDNILGFRCVLVLGTTP
jgi:hypothetical protein